VNPTRVVGVMEGWGIPLAPQYAQYSFGSDGHALSKLGVSWVFPGAYRSQNPIFFRKRARKKDGAPGSPEALMLYRL
jgi:hypothetical protein